MNLMVEDGGGKRISGCTDDKGAGGVASDILIYQRARGYDSMITFFVL